MKSACLTLEIGGGRIAPPPDNSRERLESDDSSYTYLNLTPNLKRQIHRKISSVSLRSFLHYVINIVREHKETKYANIII